MNSSALLRFSRRLAAADRRAAVLDICTEALQEAFDAAASVAVVPCDEHLGLWSSGDLHALPGPGDDPDLFRWKSVRRRFQEQGLTVLRTTVLGREPGADPDREAAASGGFIAVGWPEGSSAGDEWDDAAFELAADQLTLALHRTARETELEHSSRALEEAQDQLAGTRHLCMLGEISSGVAHDFNNALTTILGTTEWLLQHATLEDEAREDLTHIRTASTDAAVYVRRLQEAAHQVPRAGQGGGSELPAAPADDTGPVDLSAIAVPMPALTKGRWQEAVRRGVPVEVVVDAEPVSPIRGCAPEIRELLQNLVFNAIDAMQDRGGRVTVRVRGTDDQVTLSVIDQGDGIPYDVRPHIFEPFYTTKGSAGCGLGLSVCWRIAQKHGGSLEVESQVGRGTTVTLTLPVEQTSSESATNNSQREMVRHSPLSVLLIDDQPDVLESVRDMLKVLGHEVETAPDGETGLAQLEQKPFDVVVTDLGMPGLDGVGVARRTKELRPGVPVVLLTGWGALYTTTPPEPVRVVLAKPPTLLGLGQALADATSEVAA